MPSILPDYEYDIFISYRQKDNKVDGWVTAFVEALKAELDATLKNPVSIYFDENPHDGLLETHQVSASLDAKLRCVVFMPIVSQTYCDPASYAWRQEFMRFLQLAADDRLGLNVKLTNGNVASRVLPIQIHELDAADKQMIESALGGPMRAIPFVYTAPGVNRPLRQHEDHPENNRHRTTYRDQINKVANALKEIGTAVAQGSRNPEAVHPTMPEPTSLRKRFWNRVTTTALLLGVLALVTWHYTKDYFGGDLKASGSSVAVIPFRNNTGDPNMSHYGVGIASEVSTKLGLSKQFDFISSLQATIQYQQTDKSPSEIGKELGVTHILTGMYQAAGENIQVAVELIDAEGKVIWTLSYKTRYKDIFELQTNIAGRVMERFSVDEIGYPTDYTPNLEAYAHYVKGLELALRSNLAEDRMKAIPEYQLAIELDSGFIEPWRGIIEEYCYYYFHRGTKDDVSLEMIQGYVDFVESRFPDTWKKKAVKAIYEYYAQAHYQKALDLFIEALADAPQDWRLNAIVSSIYLRLLKLEESMHYLAISIKQNPAAVTLWNQLAALTQMNGDYTSAAKAAATLRALNPDLYSPLYNILRRSGKLDQVPEDLRIKAHTYVVDTLLEARNMVGLLKYLQSPAATSLAPDHRLSLEIAANYALGNDQNVERLCKEYLRLNYDGDQLRDIVLAMMKKKEEYRTRVSRYLTRHPEDLYERWYLDREMMVYEILSGNYVEADRMLKDLNSRYPQVGDFAFLNSQLFDRIRREYPPFDTTVRQLKRPPRLMESGLIAR